MTRPPLFDRLFLAMAASIYGFDQLTKSWIERTLGPGAPRHSFEVLGDWLRIGYTTNTGAAFGLGQNLSIVFTGIAFVAIPAIFIFNRTITPRGLTTRLCLGGLLGGTLGNLTDRLTRGHVVDFVDVGIGDLRWPSFNVADSSFVVGIIVLSIYMFLTDPARSHDQRYA